MIPPSVIPTRYDVSLLPEGHIDYDVHVVTVEWRGDGKWAVSRRGSRYNLGIDETWDLVTSDDLYDGEWLSRHRFPLAYALWLARRHAGDWRVSGMTAYDILREESHGRNDGV